MEKKKLPDIEITELFIVKAGSNRTYVAEIKREKDEDGKTFVHGSIVVNEGKIWSAAITQDELGNYLDDICTLKLDYGLHSRQGLSTEIFGTDFCLN
jgi:hypothetical protein